MTSINELFDEAAYTYTIGNFEDAAHKFQSLVDKRHAPAATYLAEMYQRGEGVSRNVARAIELLEQAIEWGDPLAAYNLGAWYRSGAFGIAQDKDKSKRYFLQARTMGCTIPVNDYL